MSDPNSEATGTTPSSRRRRLQLGIAAGAFVLLAGAIFITRAVTGHNVDEDSWRAEVESTLGLEIADWNGYMDVWLDTCDEDKGQFELTMAVFSDNGDTAQDLRMNIRYACPDRLDDLEDALGGTRRVADACDAPPSSRSEEQDLLAEAMGC